MSDQNPKKFFIDETDIDEITEDEMEALLTEVDNEPFEKAKAAVEEQIQKLRDALTPINDEKDAIHAAVEAAQIIADKDEATKEEVDEQVTALQSILGDISTLSDPPDPEEEEEEEEEDETQVDKTTLNILITQATAKVTELEEKGKPFLEAIAAAEAVTNKNDVTKEELEEYLPEIEKKVKELIPPTLVEDEPEGDNGSEPPALDGDENEDEDKNEPGGTKQEDDEPELKKKEEQPDLSSDGG